jgi:ATP-binding cassette subfamily B protein
LLPNPSRTLLLLYLRPQWPRALVLVLLLLAGVGLQLANPQVAGAFIDQAQAGEPLERLASIALLFIGLAALSQVATIAETYVAEDLGWRTTNALRADLTRHVLELDTTFQTEHTAGELIERIDGDVSAIAEFFARFVVHVLGSGVFLVGVLALLYLEDWRIGGVLTLALVAVGLFMLRGGGFVAARSRVARQAAADVSAFLEEHLGALPDLKANGADAYVVSRLNERLWSRFDAVRRSVLAGSQFNSVVWVGFVVGCAAALGTSAALYGAGAITLGSVYVVFRYSSMLRQPFDRLTRQINQFQQASGGIVRVAEILGTRSALADGSEVLRGGPLALELRNISFAYGDAESVLQDVSVRLEPGEVLGLLGRTGSGKTTISRLVFRLHDPLEGEIKIADVNVRRLTMESVRARVGLVTQDVQLFQGTLRDNVALFDSRVCDNALREAFRRLDLESWLESLPAGLDTRLGAGGRGLSAGEAQLVALARVFLKSPGLVVLDEASSRLDPTTERLLENAVSRLLEGRTGVIIAHRLATVERADKIMILEAGSVAEFGRRCDLVRDRSSYFTRLLRAGMAEALA